MARVAQIGNFMTHIGERSGDGYLTRSRENDMSDQINGGDLTADRLRGFSFTYDGVSIEIPPSNDPESFYLAVRCAMQALMPEPPEDKP